MRRQLNNHGKKVMTNAQFKAAAKAEGVKVYSLRKTSRGYKISYCYIINEHSVTQQQDIEIYTHDLEYIFQDKFAGRKDSTAYKKLH